MPRTSCDANCGPLSQITGSGALRLANTCFIFGMTHCDVGVLVCAISRYRGQRNKQLRIEEDANQLYRRPQMTGQASVVEEEPTIALYVLPFTLHTRVGHSRSFAMESEAVGCSSRVPSTDWTGTLGNVLIVSQCNLSPLISQVTISIDWPAGSILSLLGDSREFSGEFRLAMMWESQSSDCKLRVFFWLLVTPSYGTTHAFLF